jgi:opacity protein-like surface antigen
MKKLFITSCAILGLMLTFNTTSFAQEGRIQIGPSLVYGTEIEQPGIAVDGYYTINEQFRAGLGLTYFFPNDFAGGEVKWFGIDINGNYIFYNEDQLMAYGLAGINIISASVDFDGAVEGSGTNTNSETGLNLGAGVEYALDFGNLFGELKFGGIGGDANQIVIGAGVRFDI